MLPDFAVFHGSAYAALIPAIIVAVVSFAQSIGVATTCGEPARGELGARGGGRARLCAQACDELPGVLFACNVLCCWHVRRYAREAHESVDADQELVAMGAASVASACFGGFAQASSSLPYTPCNGSCDRPSVIESVSVYLGLLETVLV
jgi:hypothetical protein